MSLSRIGYLILAFVICWSTYYLFDKGKEYDIQVEPDTELPMFSGEDLVNTSYNEEGIRSYVITSVKLDHYAKSGNTFFDQPILKVYKEGTTQEWEVTADRGILGQDHVLTLYDNVLAKNLLPDSGFDTMSTDVLGIQLDNRDFWADNQVTLVGPQFETVGQAMKGNFAENNAILYKHVQGRYETLTP
ncbi:MULTISPECIES: LPS export ABC transporter periplasmic protein LptC [Vibrio]|uniref:LPS export ABC transporter periplasmic protein LptC n=1 Tax=Vibrio TaxID=662 RepID=UPI00207667D3|nr:MULTISPECIES: LPS export ABC transporter periplasmic protein LptC [Vibrio]USD32252.1 LPS export ABC transporter periplasmic protein LptC [Vibrio sp. SCSIO 43186]USD45295.1 LPS export ABC transporter periplasmic protein LptC [Vibrio sp. SCSIO 43145]USD69378.1 LPS export ABC transporter periplasmic protein LptC [Vibrio sp. SCSIO 43139]USD97064.1 LPS export ABC transporter periplasmic protein LptC [Vibrio coralliilyticus]